MHASRPAPALPLAHLLLRFIPAYFFLAWLALWLARQPGQLGSLWYAGALGTAWLLRQPGAPARQPALLAGAALAGLLARLTLGTAPLPAAAAALGDVLEMLLAAALLRRYAGRASVDRDPPALVWFMLLGCCVPPLLGASLATLVQAWSGHGQLRDAWALRFVGGVVGAIALLPLAMLALRADTTTLLERIGRGRATGLAVVALGACVFSLSYMPFPFMGVLIPLAVVALSLSLECTLWLAFLIAVCTGAMMSLGYFYPPPIYGRWQKAMIYLPLLAVLVTPLMLAISMHHSRRKDALRVSVEQELERNHARLQTIIDNMPALVAYWDRDLSNGFGNRTFLDWINVQPDQLRHHHLREVIGEERYASAQPHIDAVLAGHSQMFERTMSDASGQPRHTMVSYVPDLSDGAVVGFYAFVHDITTLKLAQRQQHEARSQLQAVIDAASEFAIVSTDTSGMIELFSTGAQRMLGYRADEMVGRRTPECLHLPEEIALRAAQLSVQLERPIAGVEALIAVARLGQVDEQEWRLRRKDGGLVPVRLVTTAVHDADGRLSGFLGIAHDITRQQELESSLVTAKDAAEAASLAKSEFVANMSHEIRTPLNAVLGMAYLLDTPALAPEQRNYVAMIRSSGRSLLSILNDILDFEKVEAGRMELSEQPFRLDDVLGTLANIMTVNAGDKPLDLALGVEPDVPRALVGDGQRLQQVLVNLAGNAIKFTDSGEVALLVEHLPARPPGAAAPADGSVLLRFTVRDTGIGIPQEQQQRLFGAFFQGDSSISRRYGGTGLGLAISRRLVELMGGQILLRSQPGKGSTFSVTLPFRQAGGAAPGSVQDRPQQLLLVGPPRTSLAYLGKTLAAAPVRVQHAEDSEATLAALRAHSAAGRACDAVLIDWPPAAADSTIVSQIRALTAAAAPAPHIILLADGAIHTRLLTQSGSHDADAVLVKPVTRRALHETLQRLRGAAQASEPNAVLPGTGAAPALAGVRLLLVEDNPLNQIVACGMLRHAGATVILAGDGVQALERLREGPREYDLVLMDVQMPRMDGYSAARAIRHELQLNLPILAMTAGVTQAEQRLCRAAGMNDVIAKPVEVDEMLATIVRTLVMHSAASVEGGASAAAAALAAAAATAASAPNGDSAALDQLARLAAADPAYRVKLHALVSQCIEEAPEKMRQLRLAWEAGHRQACAEQLHTLRGAVGMFGARQFAELSLALEQAIAGKDHASVGGQLDAADTALQLALQGARQWLARQPQD
ncbi:response regulator [Oxalobacteraceae bacterium]|nr:response regulator [Oxalobacteraceae bacterium]